MIKYSRRNFLKSATAVAAGGLTMRGGLADWAAQSAEVGGYKAIVCVMMFGGLDCHDVVLPIDQASYDQYADARSTLLSQYNASPTGNSRSRDRLLPLDLDNQSDFGSRAFGLPDSLQPLHALFQQGKAAIVGNVGPLIEPTNRTSYRDRSVRLPAQLFSHNDQQSTWLASRPEGARFGWGGRFADFALASGANISRTFTAVSANGNSVFLSGETAQQFQVSTRGASSLRQVTDDRYFGEESIPALLSEHFRNVGGLQQNYFMQDIAEITDRSISANAALAETLEAETPFVAAFPDTRFAQQLQVVARMIAARRTFGVGRQVFFVGAGGNFDSHSRQAMTMPEDQLNIAQGIAAFQAAMEEINEDGNVVLFTTSDFGRTLTINNDGTDHGWGGHHFVVGGPVDGRKIFGTIPPSTYDHAWDSGRGRLIPSVSVEQYAGTFGRWFGLTNSELAQATPNIVNFPERTLGFL